jgi:hypothetical protein
MRRLACLCLLGLLPAGCTSSGEAGPADAALTDGAVGDATPTTCNDPLAEQPDGGVCLLSVSGKLVDESGAPLSDVPVSVCGSACFYGRAASDGTFTVPIRQHLKLSYYALDVDGRPDRLNYYVVLPAPTASAVQFAAPLLDPLLPTSGPEIKLDGNAQTINAGDVTIEVAQGTQVMIDVEDEAIAPLGHQLRPVTVKDPKLLPFIDAAHPPDALFGFAPFETEFSVKTPVSFANVANLPKGAAVDVLAQRGLNGLVEPPPGIFARVAGAHVSADGTRVTMDPGEGILHLTWLALVKK